MSAIETYTAPGVGTFFVDYVIPFVILLALIWVGWLLRRHYRGPKSGNEEL